MIYLKKRKPWQNQGFLERHNGEMYIQYNNNLPNCKIFIQLPFAQPMKKYIPFLIITSLLLSACSFNWNNKEDLFQKKEDCARHINEANAYFKETNDWWLSIFYSKKLNTCVVAYIGKPKLEWNYNPKDPVIPTTKKYIFDFLTKEIIIQTADGIEWNNKITELKWE